MSVKQSIKVTNAGLSPILSVAQGTGAIEYEFTVSDFDIPSGSAAVAYNIQPTGNIVSQTCSISGNTITVKPPAYYFLRGKNYMQFQVSRNNEDLFSFLIEVWCAPNISQPEVIVAENPSLVSQLISDVGLLSSQLDNLLSIPSGSLSTSADAALADIKVGWDGTTYDTPGDAVRGQAEECVIELSKKSSVNSYIVNGLGYAEDSNGSIQWINGYINTVSGDITHADNVISTKNFVSGIFVLLTGNDDYQFAVGKYNSEGTFIGRGEWSTDIINISDTSYKYKISLRHSDGRNLTQEESTAIIIVSGSYEKAVYNSFWEHGGFSSNSDGKVDGRNDLYRTKGFVNENIRILHLVPQKNLSYCLQIWSKEGIWIERTSFFKNDYEFDHQNYKYKISVFKQDGIALTETDLKYIKFIPFEIETYYSGHKVSVLGDSIGTYEGYIVEGNGTYYPHGDVDNVNKTWWKKIINALGMELLVNNSWSGGRVTNTFDDTVPSAMQRAYNLSKDNIDPDDIFFLMGYNDFLNNVSLGTYDGTQEFPTSGNTFRDAYAITLKELCEAYPYSRVWCFTLTQFERFGNDGFPEKGSNGSTLKEWNDAIVELATLFGCEIIRTDLCGITYQNLALYMSDWNAENKTGLHPNNAGTSLMANAAISKIDNSVRTRY